MSFYGTLTKVDSQITINWLASPSDNLVNVCNNLTNNIDKSQTGITFFSSGNYYISIFWESALEIGFLQTLFALPPENEDLMLFIYKNWLFYTTPISQIDSILEIANNSYVPNNLWEYNEIDESILSLQNIKIKINGIDLFISGFWNLILKNLQLKPFIKRLSFTLSNDYALLEIFPSNSPEINNILKTLRDGLSHEEDIIRLWFINFLSKLLSTPRSELDQLSENLLPLMDQTLLLTAKNSNLLFYIENSKLLEQINLNYFKLQLKDSIESSINVPINILNYKKELLNLLYLLYNEEDKSHCYALFGKTLDLALRLDDFTEKIILLKDLVLLIQPWSISQQVNFVQAVLYALKFESDEELKLFIFIKESFEKHLLRDYDGILTLTEMYLKLGEIQNAVETRFLTSNFSSDEEAVIDITESFTWALNIIEDNKRDYIELFHNNLLKLIENSPAGGHLVSQLNLIYQVLISNKEKLLILDFSTFIAKNIGKAPMLDQFDTLKLIQKYVSEFGEFYELTIYIDGKLYELAVEEENYQDATTFLDSVLNYLLSTESPDKIKPLVLRLITVSFEFRQSAFLKKILRVLIFDNLQNQSVNKIALSILLELINITIENNELHKLEFTADIISDIIEIPVDERLIDTYPNLYEIGLIIAQNRGDQRLLKDLTIKKVNLYKDHFDDWENELNRLIERLIDSGFNKIAFEVLKEQIVHSQSSKQTYDLLTSMIKISAHDPSIVPDTEILNLKKQALEISKEVAKPKNVLLNYRSLVNSLIEDSQLENAFELLSESISFSVNSELKRQIRGLVEEQNHIYFEILNLRIKSKITINKFNEKFEIILRNNYKYTPDNIEKILENTLDFFENLQNLESENDRFGQQFLILTETILRGKHSFPDAYNSNISVFHRFFREIQIKKLRSSPEYESFKKSIDEIRFYSLIEDEITFIRNFEQQLLKYKKEMIKARSVNPQLFLVIYLVGQAINFFRIDEGFLNQIRTMLLEFLSTPLAILNESSLLHKKIHEMFDLISTYPHHITTLAFSFDELIQLL